MIQVYIEFLGLVTTWEFMHIPSSMCHCDLIRKHAAQIVASRSLEVGKSVAVSSSVHHIPIVQYLGRLTTVWYR